MIEMAIDVPLALRDQLALERAAHVVLDPHRACGWRLALVPFLTIPGYMLEIAVGPRHEYVERRVIDSLSTVELEQALRQIVRRRVFDKPA